MYELEQAITVYESNAVAVDLVYPFLSIAKILIDGSEVFATLYM